MKMKSVNLLIFASVLALSCAPNTSITTSWKNDQVKKDSYKTIFVAVVTPNTEVRATLEGEIAFQAKQRGIKAVQSHNEIPGNLTNENMLTREQLVQVIKDNKADAVFIVSLKNQETETRYVPGSSAYYAPMNYGYYGNYYGYYSTVYMTSYEPGYYETDQTFFVETNIYDVESESLMWSAQSTTYNPGDAETFTKGYMEAIMHQLVKDKVIKEDKTKK